MITDFLEGTTYKGEQLGSGPVNLGGGKKPWKNPGVAQLWGKFAGWAGGAEGPIEQGYQSALQALLEGSAAEEDVADEEVRNALVAQGIDPAMASAIIASQKGMRAGKLGAGKAQLATSKAGDILNLGLGTTNALTQATQHDADMAFNQYALNKLLKASKSAAKYGLFGDIIGAAGMFLAPMTGGASLAATAAAGGGPKKMPYGPWYAPK